MADFEVISNYSKTMEKVKEEPASAELFNKKYQLLLNNDAYLKEEVENKVNKMDGQGLSSNDYTDTEKEKLKGIAKNANNYAHPTATGNKHIPSGGASGQILRWTADGTAGWGTDNNTTYNPATTSADGLMTKTDKAKLDGIATGANKYVHPDNASTRHVSDTEKNKWNKIGDVTSLNTTDKSTLVAAVNECFTNANNGKKSIVDAIGGLATANDTFSMLAQKIDTQREEYRATITDITTEKEQWYQKYLNMEADRNRWMNVANSKRSIVTGTTAETNYLAKRPYIVIITGTKGMNQFKNSICVVQTRDGSMFSYGIRVGYNECFVSASITFSDTGFNVSDSNAYDLTAFGRPYIAII